MTRFGVLARRSGLASALLFAGSATAAQPYPLRLTLFRRAGSPATPSVTRYSAIASDLTNQKNQFPSTTTMGGSQIDLGVPSDSQETHHGRTPPPRHRRVHG